ncbi:hypothetical protein cypCar_00043134, partial [Cyprinus carpio]
CYRYTSLVSAEPVVLEGPNMQRSSCLWHLRAPAGSRLELRVEWLLSECRDRLIIYDSVTPADSRLITSLYGCSRYEQTVQLLSSADWMTVVWKQGLYSYKDPFSLSARAWPDQVFADCSYSVVLETTDGVQGILQTPFYPSYYPPDTNCTWIFTVPSVEFGLTLFFEGYELNRAAYSQTCTQGRWSIQSRRLCGVRGLQPYAERIHLLSSTVTVSMTSEVSLTGPGLQVHYSIFNQSDPCRSFSSSDYTSLYITACDGSADAQRWDQENSQRTVRGVTLLRGCDQHEDCIRRLRRSEDKLHSLRFFSPSVWTVYLGKLHLYGNSQTEEAIRVSHIHLHHYYDDETHDYDVALLRLVRPVSSGTLAHPVCLPPQTHQLEPDVLCWVTGWGALREGGAVSDVLQKVDVRLVSEDACVRSYGYMITPRMICAGYRSGGKDACQGDSGGPLVCQEPSGRWFLAGVVSWGRGCGRPDYYGVYTRITKLSGWIKRLVSS